MGLLVGLTILKGNDNEFLRAGLAIGVLGSFTTFSTFSLDALNLMRDRGVTVAFVYVSGSVLLGLLAAYVGIILSGASPRGGA